MDHPLRPRAAALICAAMLLLATLPSAPAQDSAAQDSAEKEQAAKSRLKLMEETVAAFKVSESSANRPHKFAAKTLLRYSDPTRDAPGASALLDATVWRLGERGRPLGLLTIEIYDDGGDSGVISYEFASLADGELSLLHANRKELAWQPPGKALSMQSLADAPPPASTAAARLGQMRQLARRFAVTEIYRDVPTECRLLVQPIDRYASESDEITDGALFAFANGTNPEIGVLIECGPGGWKYGLARLSAAESKVLLDGKEVARFERGDFRLNPRSNYVAGHHPIKLAP